MKKGLSSLVLLLCLFAGPTEACDSNCRYTATDGTAAYNAGDYKKALEFWTIAAAQGDGESMNGLAVLYLTGKAVPYDEKIAFDWHLKSAKQGYYLGKENLAYSYLSGRGVDADPAKASYWLQSAIYEGGSSKSVEKLKRYAPSDNYKISYPDPDYLCWVHPTQIKDFQDRIKAFEKEDDPARSLASFRAGSDYLEGRKDVFDHLDIIDYWADYFHSAATKCGLYDWREERNISNAAINAEYADLDWVRRALTVAVMLKPGKVIYWIDLARAWSQDRYPGGRNRRLAADAWNQAWKMISALKSVERNKVLTELKEKQGFIFNTDVMDEIAWLHMAIGEFDDAYFYASMIYQDWVRGSYTEDMDYLMAAAGFARSGTQGLEEARLLVESARNQHGPFAAWSATLVQEGRFDHLDEKNPCYMKGIPDTQSVLLVGVMKTLDNISYSAKSPYAAYEIRQLIWLGANLRHSDERYWSSYTCDPKKSTPTFDDAKKKVEAAREKMPIKKLSRVGALILRSAERAVQEKNFERARSAYSYLIRRYEPWYPPAYFNRAITGVAVFGVNDDEIKFLQTYLKLAPNGEKAETARKLIAEWKPIIAAAEKLGINLDGEMVIQPDRPLINYED